MGSVLVSALVVGAAVGAFVLTRPPVVAGRPAATATSASAPPAEPPLPFEDEDGERAVVFRMPSGRPPALSCAAAKAIVKQARAGLAYPPPAIDPRELARSTSDWLDPHGLWSAADDTPVEPMLVAEGAALLADLESARPCQASERVGGALARWVGELRKTFDERAAKADPSRALAAARASIGGDERGARAFAERLGDDVGAARAIDHARAFADVARDRFFPAMSAASWSEVVLAAAVRAYVPLMDPHGAWAPSDEEASVYEVDLDAHPAPRLWERAARTPIGVRVEAGANAPLRDGDLLVEVSGFATAGLDVEQLDQLAFAAADGPRTLTILRAGANTLERVEVAAATPVAKGDDAPASDDALPHERVAFGAGGVLVLTPREVRDDLGTLVAKAIAKERPHDLVGVVLDLRGNGGGSTEGAIDTLGAFLPKATLFPMKRRDGTLETDRAPDPAPEERWTGPVATLVDGATASAAEMIAGALAAYKRGPSVGTRTYGKGCAQEYIDDDAHVGILRLTTLLYALPDGAPVQRVGLAPTIALPWTARPASGDPDEREATLAHAPPKWRGPDVRDRDARWEVPWPASGGHVGPCAPANVAVCDALSALSGWSPRRTVAARPR